MYFLAHCSVSYKKRITWEGLIIRKEYLIPFDPLNGFLANTINYPTYPERGATSSEMFHSIEETRFISYLILNAGHCF